MPASWIGSSSSWSDGVGVEAAERDLRGADQAQVLVRERVDLRLRAARVVAEAVHDRGPREVGRDVGREALLEHHVEREALERELEQHRLVLQVVELLAGHLGAAVEVEQVELRAELHVIERPGSPKRRGSPQRRSSRASSSPPSGTSGWMKLGSFASASSKRVRCALSSASMPADGLLERAPLEAVRLALRRRQPLAGLLVLVPAPVRLVQLGLLRGHLRLERRPRRPHRRRRRAGGSS